MKNILFRSFVGFLIVALVVYLSPVPYAYANPVLQSPPPNAGGNIASAGSATVKTTGTTETITQTSGNAVIDWSSFNIGGKEKTHFVDPNSSSLTVNRVHDMNPSQILGTLTSNGNIVLINPNGVFFGPNSAVDVNGLLATTSNVTNANVMAGGKLHFTPGANSNAAVVNEGTITAKDAGLVGLVAPEVANSGIITAKLGTVHMASGDTFTLDLYGDKLMEIAVSDAVRQQIVQNTGTINADGGTIKLTAAAGRQIVNSLIDVEGELHAPTFSEKNGVISIYAEGSNAVKGNVAASKGQKQGASTVTVSGLLDATNTSGTGGNISVLGDNIGIMSGAILDASGTTGGGNIKIGGDFHGAGTTPTALNTYVDPSANIFANAMNTGNGGNVAVWSDGDTGFYGSIFARGGSQAGNGGFVETSGHGHLAAGGYVNLTAPKGEKGTYLLDPTDVTISGNTTSVYDNNGDVAYYNFDEGSGTTANDSSGNGNTGTINGATYSTSAAPTTFPNPYSLSFNGTSNYVVMPGLGTQFQNSYTISFWFKTNSLSQSPFLLSTTDEKVYVQIFGGGNIEVGNNGYYDYHPSLSTGVWTNVAFVKSPGNNGTLYVNGVALSPYAGPGFGNSTTTADLWVGSLSGFVNSTYSFNGNQDDVRVYNNALSAANAAELYGSQLTVKGLEDMSQTANVSVQASHNLTMDFQGDTMTLAAGRNLTLTAGNQILTNSGGTINTSRSAGSGGNIALNAGADIALSGMTLNSHGGAITLASNTAGSGGAISLTNGALNSGGGAITLGGGATPATTPAVGDTSYNTGIYLNGANLSAAGGNISVIGTGYAGSGNDGVISTGTVQTTGSGNITITGNGGTGTINNYGAVVEGTTSAVSGDINISGTVAGAGGSGSYGIYASNGAITINGSGNITMTGITGGATSITAGNGGVIQVGGASDSGNITFNADTLNFVGTNVPVQTTGIVTYAPHSTNTTIGVAGGTGTLQITAGAGSILGNTIAGSITIGNTSDTGLMTVGANTWTTPVSLLNGSGNIEFSGAQTLGGNSLTAVSNSGNIQLDQNAKIASTASSGNPIVLAAGANFINNDSNDGAAALSPGSGTARWIVYSTQPSSDTNGASTLGPVQTIYGQNYGSEAPGSVPNAAQSTWVYGYGLLTVTASNQTITYGSSPNTTATAGTTYAYSCSPTCGSNPVTAGPTITVSGVTTSGTSGKDNAGTWNNVISVSAATAAGYIISYITGNLTVNPMAITVTAATDTKTYDGGATAVGATPTVTSGSIVAGDTGNFTETFSNRNAGTNKTLTPTGSVTDGNGGANYSITFQNNTTGIINAEAITVTAATNTKTYNGTTAAIATPTVTSGSIMAGDTANFSETYASKNAGTGLTLTPAGSVTDGNGEANYSVTFANNTTGVINQAALTVTATSGQSVVYGSNIGTLTYSAPGLIGGDTLTGALTTAEGGTGTAATHANGLDVGNYAITQGTLANSNYAIAFTPGTTLAVTPLAITVASGVTANNKTVDGTTTDTLTFNSPALAGSVAGDAVSVDPTSAYTATFNDATVANNKPVTIAGLGLAGAQSADYTLTQPSLTANITAPASNGGGGIVFSPGPAMPPVTQPTPAPVVSVPTPAPAAPSAVPATVAAVTAAPSVTYNGSSANDGGAQAVIAPGGGYQAQALLLAAAPDIVAMPVVESAPEGGPVTVQQPAGTTIQAPNPAIDAPAVQIPGDTKANDNNSMQDQDTKKNAEEKKSKAGRAMRDRLQRIVRGWNAMRARQASNRLSARADEAQIIPVDY